MKLQLWVPYRNSSAPIFERMLGSLYTHVLHSDYGFPSHPFHKLDMALIHELQASFPIHLHRFLF